MHLPGLLTPGVKAHILLVQEVTRRGELASDGAGAEVDRVPHVVERSGDHHAQF